MALEQAVLAHLVHQARNGVVTWWTLDEVVPDMTGSLVLRADVVVELGLCDVDLSCEVTHVVVTTPALEYRDPDVCYVDEIPCRRELDGDVAWTPDEISAALTGYWSSRGAPLLFQYSVRESDDYRAEVAWVGSGGPAVTADVDGLEDGDEPAADALGRRLDS